VTRVLKMGSLVFCGFLLVACFGSSSGAIQKQKKLIELGDNQLSAGTLKANLEEGLRDRTFLI
jgi:hypothetical protein